MRETLLACVAAGLLLTAAAAGQAQAAAPDREPAATFLPTDKVDFQNPASVDAFYVRLGRAVREVCDSRITDRTTQREDAACMREATEAAVARLSRPLLTAAHQAKSRTAYARGY